MSPRDPDPTVPPDARGSFARARQLALIGTGCVIMAFGLLLAPLPGPGGLPVMILGGILILRNSAEARRFFVRSKRRYPRILSPVERIRVKLRQRRQRRMNG